MPYPLHYHAAASSPRRRPAPRKVTDRMARGQKSALPSGLGSGPHGSLSLMLPNSPIRLRRVGQQHGEPKPSHRSVGSVSLILGWQLRQMTGERTRCHAQTTRHFRGTAFRITRDRGSMKSLAPCLFIRVACLSTVFSSENIKSSAADLPTLHQPRSTEAYYDCMRLWLVMILACL